MRSFKEGKKMSSRLQEEGFNAGGSRSPVCPGCGVFLETTGLLLTGDEIHVCPDHGCYWVGRSTHWFPRYLRLESLPRLSAEAQGLALNHAFACLLGGVAGDYLVVHDLEEPRQYVQLEVQDNGDGTIYGEVGAREWTLPTRPLAPGSVAALQTLGFAGGGRGKNYRAEGLFPDPHSLAQLTLRLFATAYPESEDPQLAVLFKNAVSAKACIEELVEQNRSSFGG